METAAGKENQMTEMKADLNKMPVTGGCIKGDLTSGRNSMTKDEADARFQVGAAITKEIVALLDQYQVPPSRLEKIQFRFEALAVLQGHVQPIWPNGTERSHNNYLSEIAERVNHTHPV